MSTSTEIETWLTGSISPDVKRAKKKNIGLWQIRGKSKGACDSKTNDVEVNKERKSKSFVLTMKRRIASDDSSINSRATSKNEENDDMSETSFGPIDWENIEVPEPDPVRINIRSADIWHGNPECNNHIVDCHSNEGNRPTLDMKCVLFDNGSLPKSSNAAIRLFPIPPSHLEAIRKSFGDPQDLYRDVFGLNRHHCTDQQLRIAYFRKGREILQEQRETKHSKDAKEKFQATTMAFEILSKPEWKDVYDSVMFSGMHLSKVRNPNNDNRMDNDDDNESKAEQSIGGASLFSNGGYTVLSNGSLGSGPILRRRSSFGADRLQRSTGSKLRWNEEVEELVFRTNPNERKFKTASEKSPNDKRDSDNRDDDNIASEGDLPQRVKSKGKKKSKKIVMDADHLTQELINLDLHFEKKTKKSFANDLLDDFETGLENIGANIGAKIEGFMRFALKTPAEATKDSVDERILAQADRPNPETYIPDNSILASEEDSSYASTNKTSISGTVTTFHNIPDFEVSPKEDPDVNNKDKPNLDDMVVRQLFDDLVRPPSFESWGSLSEVLGTAPNAKNKILQKEKDSSVPIDSCMLGSTYSNSPRPNLPLELRSGSPNARDSVVHSDGIILKEHSASETDPFLNVPTFPDSKSPCLNQLSASPEYVDGEATPSSKKCTFQGTSTQGPTGLIVKAKMKRRSSRVPEYVCAEDESISALSPGTGKLCRAQSVSSRISGRETILDEESKASIHGDYEEEIIELPWPSDDHDKAQKCTFAFSPCSVLNVDDAVNRTTDATTKGFLLLVRSSSGSLYGTEKNMDDSSVTSASIATKQLEKVMGIPISEYCKQAEEILGAYEMKSSNPGQTQARSSAEETEAKLARNLKDDSDFVSYVNSCITKVLDDVNRLGCDFNHNLEEARKTMEETIFIPDEGVEHLLEILEKEIHPTHSDVIVEKSFTY